MRECGESNVGRIERVLTTATDILSVPSAGMHLKVDVVRQWVSGCRFGKDRVESGYEIELKEKQRDLLEKLIIISKFG